jgi:hypothetical protein
MLESLWRTIWTLDMCIKRYRPPRKFCLIDNSQSNYLSASYEYYRDLSIFYNKHSNTHRVKVYGAYWELGIVRFVDFQDATFENKVSAYPWHPDASCSPHQPSGMCRWVWVKLIAINTLDWINWRVKVIDAFLGQIAGFLCPDLLRKTLSLNLSGKWRERFIFKWFTITIVQYQVLRLCIHF